MSVTKRWRNRIGCKPSNSSWVSEMEEGLWGFICDTKILLKLKGKFYWTAVRLEMLYETKCLTVKNQHEIKVTVAKMKDEDVVLSVW